MGFTFFSTKLGLNVFDHFFREKGALFILQNRSAPFFRASIPTGDGCYEGTRPTPYVPGKLMIDNIINVITNV